MNTTIKHQQPEGRVDRSTSRFSRFLMHVALPGAALLGGILITVYLLNSGPQAKPVQRKQTATLVEVRDLHAEPQQTMISAMGTVIPAREVAIMPQVSGRITATSEEFLPGGHFQAGEEIVTIERTDYELALKQIKADVANAESELALEMGNQRIAEQELSLLGETVSQEDKELILRQPQLIRLQAARDNALARLEQARLNLQRTTIQAPFNGVLTQKAVDIGAKVGESTTLATIVGTDAFWLKLTLPVEQLRWLDIPQRSTEKGAEVTIHPQGTAAAGMTRKGEVIRLISGVEEQGRMAQLLVKIEDPLGLREENRDKPRLLLGSYVNAVIQGITIDSGYAIPRANLHDNNTAWLMDDEGKLVIKPVEVTFRGHDRVIVTDGLQDGDRLVVSPLASPIAGTPLKVMEGNTSDKQVATKEASHSKGFNHVN